MLFLVTETSLHDSRTKVTKYATHSVRAFVIFFGFGTFTDKAGDDSVVGAIVSRLVVGIDCVAAEPFDFHAGQFLLIFNALLYTHTLIEGFKGVVLNERDSINLYVVDLGSEFHPFVFLAPHDGSDVGAVYADNAVFDFLPVEMGGLLAIHLLYRHQPPFLVGRQMYDGMELLAQPVPLP